MPELTKVQTGFLETGVDLDTSTSPLSLSGVQGIKIDKFRIYSFDSDNDKNLGSPTFRHTETNEDLVFRTVPNGTGTVQFEFFATDITGSTATNWDNLRFNVNSRGAIVNTSAGSTGTAKDLIFEANSNPDSAANTVNKNQLYISTTGTIGINIDPDDQTNQPGSGSTAGSKLKVYSPAVLGSDVNDRDIVSSFISKTGGNISNLDILTRRFATSSAEEDPDTTWRTSEYRLEYHVDNNSNKRAWLSFYQPSTSTSTNAIRFGEHENTEWMRIQDGLLGVGLASPDHLLDLYQYTNTSGSSTGTTLVRLTNNPGSSSTASSDLNHQKTFIDFRFLDDNSNETPQVRIGGEVGENGNADTQLKEGSGAFVVYTNQGDSLSGDASLTEKFRVDYRGHVGIGVTNPQTRLQIGSTTISDQRISIFSDTTNNGDSFGSFEFRHGVHNGNINAKISALRKGGSSGADLVFYTRTQADSTNNDGGVQRLRMTSTGEVGIGNNDTPDTLLHLTGDRPKLRIESTNQLTDTAGYEEIGRIEWEARKNNNYNVAASIRAIQDGTWSTVTPWFSPSTLEFYTQDQSGIEETLPRLSINRNGYTRFRSKGAEYGGISLIHDRLATVSAGSFVTGVSYVITTLGDTDWNAAAGTSGQTYALGDSFTAANAGSGTGEADGGSITNVNFIDFNNENGVPTGHLFCNQETDNSSYLRFAVTPASSAADARTTDRRTEALRLLSDRSYSLQHDHSTTSGNIGMIKRGFAEASYFKKVDIPEKSTLTLGKHQQYLFTIPLGLTKVRLYTSGTYAEKGIYFEISKTWGVNSLPIIHFRDGAHHQEFDLHYQNSGNEQCDIYLNYRYDPNSPDSAVNNCRFYVTTQAAQGSDITRTVYEKASPPALTGGYVETTRLKNGLSIVDTGSSELSTVAIGAKHPNDTRQVQKSFITYGAYNEELFSIKRFDVDDPFTTNLKELYRVSDETGCPVMTVNNSGFIRITNPHAIVPGNGRSKEGGITFGTDASVIGIYRDSSSNLVVRQGYSSPNHLVLAGAGSVVVSLDVNNNDNDTKAFIIGKNSYTSHIGTTNEIARFREGGGLCFNGDTTAVNALDDYEEGDHTPTFTLGSGSISTTHASTLHYTKIGELVHVTGRIHLTLSTADCISFQFTLPFTAKNLHPTQSKYETSVVNQVIRATEASGTSYAGIRVFRVLNNTNYAYMQSTIGQSSGNFGVTNPHINVNITYHAA